MKGARSGISADTLWSARLQRAASCLRPRPSESETEQRAGEVRLGRRLARSLSRLETPV